jgi:hypothetical protein
MFTALLALLLTSPAADPRTPALLEDDVLAALREGRHDQLPKLQEKLAALANEERAAIPFRIKPGAVEFHFRGEFPGKEFGPDMFEYVVSKKGEKGYESILEVGDAEHARLHRLGRALDAMAKDGKTVTLDVSFAWAEKGQPQVVDLWSLLSRSEPGKRRDFVARLHIDKYGMLAFNTPADAALLPKDKAPALVVVSVRVR